MKGQKKGIMSFKAAVQLAAPHTWPSSILPVLLGAGLSWASSAPVDALNLLFTLCAAVLLQAAVNTLNDYADFVSGLDTEENCTDNTDAALIYECSSPRSALVLGLLFLLGAAAFGAGLLVRCGWAMLIYAGIALGAILLYTLPWISFSRLPLGELLSGGVMGGVLSCASYHAQAGGFSGGLIFLTLPMMIMIGSIMLVNNTSDIEKDREGGRKTLPVCIGRKAAQILLRSAVILSALLTAAIVCIKFPGGIPALPVMAAALIIDPFVSGLFTKPISPERRPASMRGILSACVRINGLYAIAVVIQALNV